jgi:hypothetical protein
LRPSPSTTTAIARVSDDIRLNIELNQPTILVLLAILRQRYGFHATAAALVSFYLFPQY